MPTELFRKFKAATGIEIFEGYGLTEATCASAANPPDGERRVGSVGLRFPYQQIRTVVLNEAGGVERDCDIGETGVVFIGGPSLFAGYKDQPELTAKSFAEAGWLNTGDLGRLDSDGYLWLAGRAKDLIIRSGHNIDPAMIENTLMMHPDVALAAAIGECDAYAGEVPIAYVKLLPGAKSTASDIKAFARTSIPESGAAPTRIEIVDDLPLTPIGKVFKPTLRERSASHVARQALQAAGVDAEIEAFTDPNKGLSITVRTHQLAHREVARNALGKFTFRTVIEE